jgi:hypothetical protein
MTVGLLSTVDQGTVSFTRLYMTLPPKLIWLPPAAPPFINTGMAALHAAEGVTAA